MYTLAATAMSTVSMSIVGAYMQMRSSRATWWRPWCSNMFSTFIVLSLINPYEPDNTVTDAKALAEGDEHHTPKKENFFEMLGEYIMAGFTVAVIVGAMLVGFIALIAPHQLPVRGGIWGQLPARHGLHLLPHRLDPGHPER